MYVGLTDVKNLRFMARQDFGEGGSDAGTVVA